MERTSAREISNVVSDQAGQDIISNSGLSAMIYAWGQFIDHDLDLTPTNGAEPLSIAVPMGDTQFDPNSTGAQTIDTTRSIFDPTTGTYLLLRIYPHGYHGKPGELGSKRADAPKELIGKV